MVFIKCLILGVRKELYYTFMLFNASSISAYTVFCENVFPFNLKVLNIKNVILL